MDNIIRENGNMENKDIEEPVTMNQRTIGFIINPVAGMGGRVGLKGTDDLAARARELGATEISGDRAGNALRLLFQYLTLEKDIHLTILTAGRPMGHDICEMILGESMRSGKGDADGFLDTHDLAERIHIESVYKPTVPTTARDTVDSCRRMVEQGAELILFTGGDGTARDVVKAVGEGIPVLGIPSGVKMHSGVFTYTPPDAGRAMYEFLLGMAPLETRDVIDLDEDEYRHGRIRTRLFGYAKVPVTTRLQGCKNLAVTPDDDADRQSIALGLEEFMKEHPGLYILGAGSTLRDIGNHLGLELTPLGFDVVLANDEGFHLVLRDGNEISILNVLDEMSVSDERIMVDQKEAEGEMKDVFLVITPIGAQGFILGRGTQVISNTILKRIGKKRIIVVATPGKLDITRILRIDLETGNGQKGNELGSEDSLEGHIKVMVGYRRYVLKRVK